MLDLADRKSGFLNDKRILLLTKRGRCGVVKELKEPVQLARETGSELSTMLLLMSIGIADEMVSVRTETHIVQNVRSGGMTKSASQRAE